MVPQYDAKPAMTRKIRYFQSSAVTGGVVTANCLFQLLVAAFNGNTTTFGLLSAVRIRSVKMWSASVQSSSTIGFSTVRLEWLGTFSRAKELSDSGTATYPAHIRSQPPADSDAAMWISQDTDVLNNALFLYDLPQGGILDLTIDMVYLDGPPPSPGGTRILSVAAPSNGIFTMPLNNSLVGTGSTGLQTTIPIANETALFA